MNKPIKLLIVVMDFYQAGAPRFAYEVDKALDKSIFNVSVLSVKNLKASEYFDDYYYSKHKELGSLIYFINDVLRINNSFDYLLKKIFFNRLASGILSKKIKNKTLFFLQHDHEKKKKFLSFVGKFDIISWVGEYTFGLFLNYMDDLVYNKSVIHLMSAKFQNVHNFNQYPKNKHYSITSGFDDEDQINYELSDIKSYSHLIFPLSIEINQRTNQWKFKHDKTKNKIGIFTRLDHMKPLDTFFASFHLMLDSLPNSELHIFGAGDSVKTGMQRLADNFDIIGKVFFSGHQQDIVQTAIEEELDLVWFHGYKNRPAGYAGFDICTTGIPQIFWDFSNTVNEVAHNTTYPHFKNLNLFVKKSYELLSDEQAALSLSNKQFNDVIANRNIKKNIQTLENLLISIAGKPNLQKDESEDSETTTKNDTNLSY